MFRMDNELDLFAIVFRQTNLESKKNQTTN